MPDTAPLKRTIQATVPNVAQGASADQTVGEAPFAGTVTAVTYTPEAAITGAATNNRVARLINKGQSGAGAVVVASLTFDVGVNAAAFDEKTITLSATPANLVVAKGDILAWESNFAGTGIADPGGLVQVEIARG